jgi:hypothetical protein
VHQSVLQDESVLMRSGLTGDIDQPPDESDFSDEEEELDL